MITAVDREKCGRSRGLFRQFWTARCEFGRNFTRVLDTPRTMRLLGARFAHYNRYHKHRGNSGI